ncbi:MAG: stage II sporulation protein M [Vulcanimicrobiaceae bacterium]
MNQQRFVESRRPSWERLDALLERFARKGGGCLSAEEVGELGPLYRHAAADLAYARGASYDTPLIDMLNRLVARAHARVYAHNATPETNAILAFFSTTFPREFRRSIGYIGICTLLTIACAIVSYVVISNRPGDAFALLPTALISPEIHKSLHNSNFAFNETNSPAVAAQIVTNNIRVAFLAFAGSATLGILTIWVIIQNGLMLGGVGALFTRAGFGYGFWATIAPHGFIELTAIQVAGAAGLLIAAGVLYPGDLRRRDALVINARRAGTLILGVAAMLSVAATIEGFFSPLRLPANLRIGFGLMTAVALVAYFALAGRARRSREKAGAAIAPWF